MLIELENGYSESLREKVANAIDSPRMSFLCVAKGAITHDLAIDLRTLVSQRHSFAVKMFECSVDERGDSNETSENLSVYFSSGFDRIDFCRCFSGDSSQAVVGWNALFRPASFDNISSSLAKVSFNQCNFYNTRASLLKEWLSLLTSLRVFRIESSCVHDDGICRFLAGALRGIQINPSKVYIGVKIEDPVGFDLMVRQIARQKSIKTLSLCNYYSFGLPPLTGVAALASNEGCQLESLYLSGFMIESREWLLFFNALESNSSLCELTIMGHDSIDQASQNAVIECLRRNRCLKSMYIRKFNSSQKLLDVLSSNNSVLSKFRFEIFDDSNDALPYVARNWAGRRLLGKQNQISLSIWPRVLSRINRVNIADYYQANNVDHGCFVADAMFHILRYGNFLFSQHSGKLNPK